MFLDIERKENNIGNKKIECEKDLEEHHTPAYRGEYPPPLPRRIAGCSEGHRISPLDIALKQKEEGTRDVDEYGLPEGVGGVVMADGPHPRALRRRPSLTAGRPLR